MKLDLAVSRAMFLTELRSALRDRRTVIFSILLPALITPLLMFVSHFQAAKHERELAEAVHPYAVSGPEAALARALLAEAGGSGAQEARFEESLPEDPAAALDSGTLQVWVEALPPEPEAERPVPQLRLHRRGDREESLAAARQIQAALERAIAGRQEKLLAEHGVAVGRAEVLPAQVSDLAPEAGSSGSRFGRLLTFALVFLVLGGGSVVAVDALAGEKERGTLETLLTSAAGRRDIIVAKLAVIFCVALAITLIQVVNIAIWGGREQFALPDDLLAALTPGRLLLLFALFLPVIALLSALLLYISGLARTYREAQSYFLPLFLGALLPPAAALLPGVELRSAIVLVPISNIAVGVMELLSGRPDWPMLAVAWLVTAAAAAGVVRLATRTLTGERLLGAGAPEAARAKGGPALFARQVPLWFGLFWVIQFVAALNVEWLQPLERQVLFNVVLIFGGGSLLLIRRYRLDPRQALALRAPHPAAWLAVLIGVPAGLLTGIGVFRLASLLFPVPEALLKAFAESLAPQDLPAWQMLLLLAVLPGVFEEVAFRGVLTYGLSKRLRPVALVLTVGLVFGLFHQALFRIAPTAFLGVLLTAVVLLTGSIFPAMLWHALSNALALLAGRAGADLAELPAAYYAAAAVVLALAFWILWRTRRPYPELRT
ncbi:MAG: ABC transporter permease subunit [Acidobacteria bacterium]|nr:ABC transporter permease subunit [Acidobacteriota bacterium]